MVSEVRGGFYCVELAHEVDSCDFLFAGRDGVNHDAVLTAIAAAVLSFLHIPVRLAWFECTSADLRRSETVSDCRAWLPPTQSDVIVNPLPHLA